MSIAKLYTNEVKKQLGIYFANWMPGDPIELGDYGIMDGNIFIHKGTLQKDYPELAGTVIKYVTDTTTDQKEFKSESGIEVRFHAKGSVTAAGTTLAKATLEINFEGKDSIFFNAAECTTNRIANKVEVGAIIKELFRQDRWKKEYCVVTDVVQAGKTIVAISQARNASISFEAESPAIDNISLSDASIGIGLTSEKNIGFKIEAADGLKILMGLCKIKNLFPWTSPDFKPKFFQTESVRRIIENHDDFKTENSTDELAFGQIGKE